MPPWVWVSAVVAGVTAVVSVMWWAVGRVTEARIARVEAEAAKVVAEAKAAAAKAEAIAERHMLAELRDRLPVNSSFLSKGQALQQEIESSLGQLMRQVGATESSVLVRDPDPSSEYLFFLALNGRSAKQLRKVMVGKDSIAGKVLRSGEPMRVANPYENPVGVAQFLNKLDEGSFGDQEESIAVAESGRIALKVAEFVRDTENYVQLGLYSPPGPSDAVIMFCDLSSSSSLFEVLHESGAISCLNDYLSQMADIVLTAGGSVDQYLGDGAMFRFIEDSVKDPAATARRAAEVAIDAVVAFQAIKRSWLASRWEVGAVFSRVSLAYGDYRETLIGPTRHRERVILGSGVHRAAELCEMSSRQKNVIVVDKRMAELLADSWNLEPGPANSVFELLGKR